MRSSILKIIFAVFLVSSVIPLFPAKEASAQLAVYDAANNAVNTIIAGAQTALNTISQTVIAPSSVSTATAIGAPGTAAVGVSAIRSTLSTVCQSIIVGYDNASAVATTAESASSTALSVLGGGSADLVKTSAKLAAATTAFTCVSNYATALSLAPGVTLTLSAELQREQTRFESISASLKQSIQDLTSQQNAAAKDILKAFMVRTILNVSKNLTTEMVNKMVEKYKISDYLAYGDAVATQVYSMKYINDNFAGDARQQMMIRSMLQSEKAPQKIKTVQTFANSKAQEYLATACNVGTPGLNTTDQNYFLKCLAAYGAPQANAQYHFDVASDQAKATMSAARATAQTELAQSAGFAPPRNCRGSLAAQQQIDAQYEKATSEKSIASAVVARLNLALKANPPQTTQAELDKALAAEAQAIANLNALTKNVRTDANGKTTDSPIIDICEAIDSPAQFVASSINSYLSKHFNESSQLKSENLPFYANFLSDVASNFLTNILTGGKPTSQVLKETGVGVLNGAIIGISQAAQSNQIPDSVPANPTGRVEIYALVNGQRTTTLAPNSAYELVIDFKDLVATSSNGKDPVLNPYRLLISGASAGSDTNLPISAAELAAGRMILDGTTPNNNQSFSVVVQAFARAPQGTTGDVPLNTTGGWTQRFVVGSVGGVASVLPRGPAIQFR